MTTLAVIQARYGSARLPGKVLADIGGYSVLQHVWVRVAPYVDDAVVAYPATPENKPLREHLGAHGLYGFGWGGPEDDVLGRVAAAARACGLSGIDLVVRVTADCPFLDPESVQAVVDAAEDGRGDYVSNLPADPPVDGLDVEAFTAARLYAADAHAVDAYDREHVTPWIKRNAGRVWTTYRAVPTLLHGVEGRVQHRWTLDTPADLAWFQRIAEHVDCDPPRPTVEDLLDLFAMYPSLVRQTGDG